MARQKRFPSNLHQQHCPCSKTYWVGNRGLDFVWPTPARQGWHWLIEMAGRTRPANTAYHHDGIRWHTVGRPSHETGSLRLHCQACESGRITEKNRRSLECIILRFETDDASVPNRWRVYPKQTIRLAQTDDAFRQDEKSVSEECRRLIVFLRLPRRRERRSQTTLQLCETGFTYQYVCTHLGFHSNSAAEMFDNAPANRQP